jgi:2-iminobutanoate/2-iminopropanoate deaminase
MKIFNIKSLPKAIGPYSHLTEIDNLIFTSGQIALDVETGELVSGGIENETRKIMENVKNALEELNMDFSNVIKTTVYITDIKKFSIFNDIYATYFKGSLPTRSVIQVSSLVKKSSIEIEFILSK